MLTNLIVVIIWQYVHFTCFISIKLGKEINTKQNNKTQKNHHWIIPWFLRFLANLLSSPYFSLSFMFFGLFRLFCFGFFYMIFRVFWLPVGGLGKACLSHLLRSTWPSSLITCFQWNIFLCRYVYLTWSFKNESAYLRRYNN